MIYGLTQDFMNGEGLVAGDDSPKHVECETVLTMVAGNSPFVGGKSVEKYWCAYCMVGGYLIGGSEPGPPGPSTPEQMEKRWREIDVDAPSAVPPTDAREWQEFLNGYFPHGLLLMEANADDAHTIPHTSPILLSSGAIVRHSTMELADIEIFEQATGRPILLEATRKISELAPGILTLSDGDEGFVRLDGHLTRDECDYIEAARAGGYFGPDWSVLE